MSKTKYDKKQNILIFALAAISVLSSGALAIKLFNENKKETNNKISQIQQNQNNMQNILDSFSPSSIYYAYNYGIIGENVEVIEDCICYGIQKNLANYDFIYVEVNINGNSCYQLAATSPLQDTNFFTLTNDNDSGSLYAGIGIEFDADNDDYFKINLSYANFNEEDSIDYSQFDTIALIDL